MKSKFEDALERDVPFNVEGVRQPEKQFDVNSKQRLVNSVYLHFVHLVLT